MDFDGGELYQLRIRDLASGADLAERIDGTYYGLAWSADSCSLLYVVTDAQYRPHEAWRHRLGTEPDRDVPVFRCSARRTSGSTSPCGRPAAGHTCSSKPPPGTPPRRWSRRPMTPATRQAVLQERKTGTKYRADHGDGPGGGEFFLVTNAGAEEFRLVRAPVSAPGRAS